MDELFDPFYYNHEWWYRRVHVYLPTHQKVMSISNAV